MNSIVKKPLENFGNRSDDLSVRDLQRNSVPGYRKLSSMEIKILKENENECREWNDIFVTEKFNPSFVRRCSFHGVVRIGNLSPLLLEFHDYQIPVGLYNSTIISCDIGNDVAISNVHHLSHYLIGNEVILSNIDEMLTTNNAKFGNGILKEDEKEESRLWLEVGNENGGRRILPFGNLTTGDAYLWSRYRADKVLMDRFVTLTEKLFDKRRRYYGEVGDRTVMKSCRFIKDVTIGSNAYIKGVNKLKNLTINSKESAATQIGEGVELVNGIIDFGSRIFFGVNADRFYLCSNTTLNYGVRLINSVVGDNSTISCCEVLNSLIFAAHEQHHNNSFLCSATIFGQSNIAAGATIGSNHNSRANDGEIIAGRGFWPGLCVSLKHPSKFASFCLIAKGSYPAELNIPFPFALISNDEHKNRLQIIPAFWFLYNMYALARNSRKFANRDKKYYSWQQFEYDYLAPDSIEEIFDSLELFDRFSGNETEVTGSANLFEASGRPAIILKASRARTVYQDMIHYYGMKTLLPFISKEKIGNISELQTHFSDARREAWHNVGGQLICDGDLISILEDLRTSKIDTWDALHRRYRKNSGTYLQRKAKHAFASLIDVNQIDPLDLNARIWKSWSDRAVNIQEQILERVISSRRKDFASPFRQMTFMSQAEMESIVGAIANDEFILQMQQMTKNFKRSARAQLISN